MSHAFFGIWVTQCVSRGRRWVALCCAAQCLPRIGPKSLSPPQVSCPVMTELFHLSIHGATRPIKTCCAHTCCSFASIPLTYVIVITLQSMPHANGNVQPRAYARSISSSVKTRYAVPLAQPSVPIVQKQPSWLSMRRKTGLTAYLRARAMRKAVPPPPLTAQMSSITGYIPGGTIALPRAVDEMRSGHRVEVRCRMSSVSRTSPKIACTDDKGSARSCRFGSGHAVPLRVVQNSVSSP